VTGTIPSRKPKCTRRSARERDYKKLNARRRRLLDRIANVSGVEREQPMMTASNIHDELADPV
jgi:hypothetical protein